MPPFKNTFLLKTLFCLSRSSSCGWEASAPRAAGGGGGDRHGGCDALGLAHAREQRGVFPAREGLEGRIHLLRGRQQHLDETHGVSGQYGVRHAACPISTG